jgi:hypothetical protein
MYAVALSIAFALFAVPTDARDDFQLKRAGPEKRAIGEVTVSHISRVRSDRLLSIDVFRLRPNSVYSVWLVDNSQERTPAGLRGKNFFRTDGSGNAHYADYTDEYTLDWKTLEIAYHPGGDINDMDGMVVVLTTLLY